MNVRQGERDEPERDEDDEEEEGEEGEGNMVEEEQAAQRTSPIPPSSDTPNPGDSRWSDDIESTLQLIPDLPDI